MNQPFTYGELLAKHAKVSQDPEFKDISLPDYAAAMNEITGTQNYDQGLKDDFVRRASHKVDQAVEWTGLPQRFQSVGEGLTSILGGGPEYQQAVGHAFRGLPRTLGEIGVGVGAAALATAAAPISIPAGGVAAGGIALGTMAGLTGARTYGETGSVPQAGVSAATMLAGMKASQMVGQPILRAMGAPTAAEFAGKVAPEFAAKVGASFAPKEIGELLVASNYPQQIAKVTGMLASQIPVNELGAGISRRMQEGEWRMPSGPEFAASTASLVPFLGYDMVRDVQNPMRTFNKQVKPALQDSYVQRAVKEYVAKTGEMPPDNQIAALAREAEILPPLTGPNFKIGDDGRFEAKFNSTAAATEWAQSHASRFDGFDLEARNGITYLKVKPKNVADFLELTGNNANNSFLESRNQKYMYRGTGEENVMQTVARYKELFVKTVNEGKDPSKHIGEMSVDENDAVRLIGDAHRALKEADKMNPLREEVIQRAVRMGTVEEDGVRNMAVKIDPEHLAKEQEFVARENQRAADLAADAEAVRLMNSDPAIKAKGEFASNWYEKERGVGAKKETVMESGQHGRTTTATVGKSVDSEASRAIDRKIESIKQQLNEMRQTELFEQPQVAALRDKLRADLLELQQQKAELKPEQEAVVMEEEALYNEDGELVNTKGEVIDENADEVITGSSYGANSGVRPATPGVSEALIRAAVKYPGQVIINPEGMPRDPSERAFTSYLQGTRNRAEAAYKAQDAQGRSQGIIESTRGLSEVEAGIKAKQLIDGRSDAEKAANVTFEAVPDKKTGNGTFAVRAVDQNAIRSFEGKWQTERGDWADTEMESMIAQRIGKMEEGGQVEVAAEQGVHDLNDIRDPAVKFMRYQATVNNVASAMNDGPMHRELIRLLNLERNRKQDSELKKAKTRVLQYIDFIRKGGNLTWKIVRKPAMREVFRTTDRAKAEQYIQDRLTQADVGKTIGSRGEGLTTRDYQFTTERAENNYNVLEEAIMNQFGDQVSVGYKVMEKPKDVVEVPDKGGKSGRRGFLKVELQGDLEGFNKQLLALSARTGVDYGGFVNEANADRSGRLNERRTNGLSPAEEILAALQAVGKQFQDPRKLYERPKGDFGFLPRPYWELGRDEKGKVTAHRLGLNDPETGAYIPAHEAVKTIKRGVDLSVPAGPGVMVKHRDGTMKEHKGNWATLVDDVFRSEGVVSFGDFVSVMKQSLEKDRNAKTGPEIDHYIRVLDMLMNKGNERNWAPNIPVGVAMAKELGHEGPDGLIDGVFGWYNHSRDTLQSSGMLLSPYYTHPKTGKVYQMSALQFLPHLLHEATHGNVAHGFDVDPVLRGQGIALVQHLKQQLKLDSAWASITGAEPRTIRALRDPNREDYVSLQELAGDLLTDESLMRTLRGMEDDPTLGGNPKPMNNLFNRVMDWIKSYLLKVFPPAKGESVVDGTSLYDRLAHYVERAMEVSDNRVRMEYKGDIYSAIAKEIFGSSRMDLLGSQRPEPEQRTGESGVGRVVGGKEPVKTAGLGWSRTIGSATRPKTAEDYTEYAQKRNAQTKAERAAADAERARIEADPNRPRRLIKAKDVEPTPSEAIAKQRTDALRAELQKEYPDATIIVTRPEKAKTGLGEWEGGRVEVRSKTEYQPIPTVDLKGENELPGVIRAQGKKTIPEVSKNIEEDNGPQLIDQPLQFVQTVVQEGPAGERVAHTRVKRPAGEFKMAAYREMIPSVEGTEPVPAGPKSVPPKEKDRGPGLSAEDEATVRERWPMGTSEVEGGLRSRVERDPLKAFRVMEQEAESAVRAGDWVIFKFRDKAQQQRFADDWVDAFGEESFKEGNLQIKIEVKSILEADGHDTDRPLFDKAPEAFDGLEDLLGISGQALKEREASDINYKKNEGFLPADYNKRFDRLRNAGRLNVFGDKPVTDMLESRGPITVPEVTRALKHGTIAMMDKREESGRLWFKGEPFILGSVRPQKEGEHGWWSLSTEDLQRMAEELGTKEELFANQVKSTPQITSAYPTLIEALTYQGMSREDARRGAMLIGRYATAFKVKGLSDQPLVGRIESNDSLGEAWKLGPKMGLNSKAIANFANTPAGRLLLLREIFVHELFHKADPEGNALRGVWDELKTPEAREDVLRAASYLNKGDFQGRVRQLSIDNHEEFAADLAAHLVPGLLSGPPTAAMREATLLGTEVQQALFMEGIMHRKTMEIFSSKLAEKGLHEWAEPLTKEIQSYMRTFDEIQKDTEMFHVMRGLWPDAYLPEVMEVASWMTDGEKPRLYSASGETLQDSVLESRGLLRGSIGLSNNAKYSWWNKTLASFNRLADQFPILRPHWDMLHSASAQAQNSTMDLKLIMAGQYQAGKYKSDARSKRWRQFNMTPRLLEAHDKLVMLANQMGDTANLRMTPLEQNTFLERSGKLTDPADRALVLEVFNAQLAQNERVGDMINKAERHRDDVMLARLASKRGAGTISLEQARAQGKLVGDWAEASFMGDIVTATDLANRMATEIPQDLRNEMVELAQALITPRMEAYNTRQRGIGYWMPERRFGQWGLYYKDQNGDVQRHYFQQEKEIKTFLARARVKEADIVKLIGPAESEPNFGANPALFAALDEAHAQQVAAVRKHIGDAAADFLQKEGHFTAHVVGNLQAANPTSTSLKRTFGATRQYLTMSDVQQQYIEAAVNSIKNRIVQAENELILGDSSFDMQPESKILVRQHVDQFLKKDSEFGRRVQMANFVYFMGGNISSMVLEPFQQLMALAPVLTHNGAGLAGGYKLIAEANALWAKSKATGSFGNPDYDAAMKQWRQQGDADNGIYSELNHNEDLNMVNTIRRSGGLSQFSPYDLLKNKIYALSNFATKFYLRVPAYNSEIALLASYKLLRSQGLPHEEATKQAVFLKEGAMFGGGKRNRPVGLFGFNRTAAQVMNSLQGYSLGMTSLMGQLVRESFGGKGSGLSPAQITQARKAAAQMLMTQFAAAGALGMPFMAAALTGLQKLFPGTNPEQAVRDFLDDFDKEDKAMGGVVGTFLAKGLPALMSNGPDMSSRFALGGVLGVNPYNGWTLANLAGPSVSLVTNIFNAGREAAMTGDPAALKPMMPIGLQKMYDAATQGSSFKDAKGRMLAEDLTGTEQAARFAGFTPNRVAETRDTTRLAKINESAARERTTRLANQLADLYQAGEVERVREKILDLEPHEQATMVQAVASRLEQKTMPVDPRTIGSRMSLRSQQDLFRLMQTGRVQLPTQQERMMLHGQVAMGLAIPGTRPPSNRSMSRAAAIDMLQQQSPALSKEAASLLLDRHSRLSPQARSDMFPGGTATGL